MPSNKKGRGRSFPAPKRRLLGVFLLTGLVALTNGCQDRNLRTLKEGETVDERVQAALKLAAKKSRKAVEPLVTILQSADSDAELKTAAAHALGEIGDPAAVDVLIAALSSGLDSKVGCEAAKALGRIRDNKAVEALFKAQAGYPFIFGPPGLASSDESLIKNREAQWALYEAYESTRSRRPAVRWEAARALALTIGGDPAALEEIERKQRREWEDLLIEVVGGRAEFDTLPLQIRRFIKSTFCVSDLTPEDLEGLELRDSRGQVISVEDAEEIKKRYEKERRLKPVLRTYLILMALGEPENEDLILEAFTSPLTGILDLEPMALDLYASGHEEFRSAANSWAAARGKRIEVQAKTNIRIGGTSITAPVLLGGAKAPLGDGLPVRWGELREGGR